MGSCYSKRLQLISLKQSQSEICKRQETLLLISSFDLLRKNQNINFPIQTKFIAYSIIDRLHQENYFNLQAMKRKKTSSEILAVCVIFLASKFNDVRALKLRTILKFFTKKLITKEEIIQTQSIVLKYLKYDIPVQTAYSSLIKRATQQNSKKFRTMPFLFEQSIKILIQSIILEPSLVLSPKFGDQIYDLIWNSLSSQKILKIQQKMLQKERSQIFDKQNERLTNNTCQ